MNRTPRAFGPNFCVRPTASLDRQQFVHLTAPPPLIDLDETTGARSLPLARSQPGSKELGKSQKQPWTFPHGTTRKKVNTPVENPIRL